jgi:uncharacterized protein (TIGR02117 family)
MRTIHLVARDWHTGFVMPAKEICKLLPELRQRFGDVAFLEFGWGDRCYYQRESSLIPSASTLQVVAITDSPQKFYRAEPIEALLLEDSGFEALVQFIANSFAINQQAGLIMQCYGRTGDSQFYQARGLYHLFNTCNTWSAIGLSKAGVKIKPRFIFTAESIMAAASKGQKPYSNCR